ncbi:hypothetical protein C9F11_03065 [Streptomyces sp. YIM 121038]|nr:hypothetical protein C9F11_03065 [Streptomyces sp. YIM 121038]
MPYENRKIFGETRQIYKAPRPNPPSQFTYQPKTIGGTIVAYVAIILFVVIGFAIFSGR